MQRRTVANSSMILGVGATLFTASGFAQTASTADASSAPLEEIVVTGTLIPTGNGYQAPTPVSVAPVALLQQSTPADLVQGLKQLPQFLGSTGPQTVTFTQTVQGDVLNLRGLGPNRTLILLDGVRVPPTTYLNTVNVDVLPQLLLQRVDIVTGGASATYGSDAVAGVVNYVLNTRFTGVKAEAMAGITSRGDNQNERIGLALGTNVGAQGHFIASVEFFNSAGFLVSDRPALNQSGGAVGSVVGSTAGAGTAANPYINTQDARASYATFGGIVQSGPFKGTAFTSSGLYGPVRSGTPTGTATFFQAPSDYIRLPETNTAQAPARDINAFARYSQDFQSGMTGYVQLMASRAHTSANIEDNFLALPGFTIFSGNAFLPAPLQAQLTTGNVPSFTMSSQYNYMGPISELQDVNTSSVQVGLSGKLGRFSWKLDDVFGNVVDTVKALNEVNFQSFYAAVDTVVNPANGSIVCRATLSTDAAVAARYAGCQPFNPFGSGAASSAAQAYVTGTSRYDVTTYQNNLQGSIGGALFPLPAGSMTGALGFDLRNQHLDITSNANPGTPYDTTGLRGTSVLTQYYLINQSAATGSEIVAEAFGEVGVPLLKDAPFARSLDLNLAARYTRYSISGTATTWKLGATWRPIDDLMFRATESRDIRAPTLYDLFAGEQVAPAALTDPHTGVTFGAPQVTSGNPNLEPEIGKTFAAGLVYQPHAVQGLAMSIDFYRINMTGAIATLSALAEVQACEASNGTSPACANVIRPHPFSDRTADNFPTKFIVSGVNVAAINTNGLDVDVSYNRDVLGGKLMTRAYATYVDDFSTQLTANQRRINFAGWNAAGSGGVAGAIPHFKGLLSVGYQYQDLGVFLSENMTGSLNLGPTLIYVDKHVPGFYTTNLTLDYKGLPASRAGKFDLFLTVSNLLDATPPRVESTAVPGGLDTIASLYPTIGRMFVVGIRFSPY